MLGLEKWGQGRSMEVGLGRMSDRECRGAEDGGGKGAWNVAIFSSARGGSVKPNTLGGWDDEHGRCTAYQVEVRALLKAWVAAGN